MRSSNFNALLNEALGPVQVANDERLEDVYLFDLESLVSSVNSQIDAPLCSFLIDWAQEHPCYIVTAYDYQTVIQTLPSPLRRAQAAVFACSGADVWRQDQPAIHKEHLFDDAIYEFLAQVIQNSNYPDKKVPAVTAGPATLRLDIPGQNASIRQRKAYMDWEKSVGELRDIMYEFAVRFPEYRICRHGLSGLLIIHKAFSPSQSVHFLKALHPNAGLLGFFRPGSTSGYASELAAHFAKMDMYAEVGGPSDLAQLLKYEERRCRKSIPGFSQELLNFSEA